MTMRIVALHRYPVKSMGGQSLTRADVEPRGLVGDRRWLMTTPEGGFLTRRVLPAMALLHAEPTDKGVTLRHYGGDALPVAMPRDETTTAVTVWCDTVHARDAGDAAAAWLSARVGRSVRLAYMPGGAARAVDPAFARAGDQVSFADEFPLLITTVESLDALNRQLSQPVTMARFRPNLVIAGAAPFAEDAWQTLRIGALTLRVVKPCTRCVITTQHPDSGVVVEAMEPLRTLKAMGRVMPGKGRAGEPIFGQNAIPDGTGTIAVGDAVEIIG